MEGAPKNDHHKVCVLFHAFKAMAAEVVAFGLAHRGLFFKGHILQNKGAVLSHLTQKNRGRN